MMIPKHNPSRSVIPLFLFLSLKILFLEMAMAQNTTSIIPVNVGVVLDLDNDLDGNIRLSCINMAISDLYATHGHDYKTRLVLTIRDSMKDVVGAAASALDLIKNVGVQAILGPTTSMQANFVIDLGEKAQVPILSFSATSPLSSVRSPYFFRATQNDSTQVKAISSLVQAFGWREAVPIYIDNEYGEGIIPYLTDALQAVDARVPYRSVISPSATDDKIAEELYKLMTMQTRVFIVHMYPSLGTRLFAKAKEIGMMSEGYVWIMTDGLTADLLSSPNTSVTDTMQGALGVQPDVPRTEELTNFQVRWRKKFLQDNPGNVDAALNIYGLWAYDAATALALAVEKAGTTNFGLQKASVSSNSSTDLSVLGVSLNGPNLLQALSNTSFKGLTGNYFFVNRQLQSPAFQIVNVNSNHGRPIGFWTPTKGLQKTLKLTNNESTNSYSLSGLSTVIWSGDTTVIPKGWEIPTNEKKLRIGVPVKGISNEFIEVTKDPSSNTYKISGYCIAVFDAVVEALPYALEYAYIPFVKPDGKPAGTYNDLVYQVYLKNFDAVVGDVSIVYRRSLYVDYTLPYTESGVAMLVPTKDSSSKNAWIFLKPLTWELWVSSIFFFVLIGFVVWVLEHRINEDFRGSPSHQAGTTFWFSFSVMVFAQRERVISNLSRAVVIIWCFVVLILTQSYTASLSSLLTVNQLQPTVTDVHELIKNREYVGYQTGSFVLEILLDMGFDRSKLVEFNSLDECHDLFSKGSGNGGISAAFDVVPYLKLFQSKYCSKFTMIDHEFKTAGFGFVFPKGSPLAPDISRAILRVIQGDKMKKIHGAWFGKESSSCPDSSTSVSSNSLSLESFLGLFLIAGIASLFALFIFIGMLVYQERRVISDSTTSLWSKIRHLFSIFNQRDLTSHTFRKSKERDTNGAISLQNMGILSPSTHSVQTEFPEDSSSPEFVSSPNIRTSQEAGTSVDQLSIPIQERLKASQIDQENN